jgi:hypothetical protein
MIIFVCHIIFSLLFGFRALLAGSAAFMYETNSHDGYNISTIILDHLSKSIENSKKTINLGKLRWKERKSGYILS